MYLDCVVSLHSEVKHKDNASYLCFTASKPVSFSRTLSLHWFLRNCCALVALLVIFRGMLTCMVSKHTFWKLSYECLNHSSQLLCGKMVLPA